MRATTLWHDRFGENFELYFLKTHDGTEVDFLITHNNKPWLLIEAKEGQPHATSATHSFAGELNVPRLITTPLKNMTKKIKSEATAGIYQISWSKVGTYLP